MPPPFPAPMRGGAPMLSRRRALAGPARGLLALALLGAAGTACGPGGPPAPTRWKPSSKPLERTATWPPAAAAARPRTGTRPAWWPTSAPGTPPPWSRSWRGRPVNLPTSRPRDHRLTLGHAGAGVRSPPTSRDVVKALRTSAEAPPNWSRRCRAIGRTDGLDRCGVHGVLHRWHSTAAAPMAGRPRAVDPRAGDHGDLTVFPRAPLSPAGPGPAGGRRPGGVVRRGRRRARRDLRLRTGVGAQPSHPQRTGLRSAGRTS